MSIIFFQLLFFAMAIGVTLSSVDAGHDEEVDKGEGGSESEPASGAKSKHETGKHDCGKGSSPPPEVSYIVSTCALLLY